MEENNIPTVRGKKEIVNGLVVDQQGVHLDSSAIENAIIRASQGNSSSGDSRIVESSDGDDLDIDGESAIINGRLVDKNGFHLDKDDFISNISASVGLKVSNNDKNKGKVSQKTASVDLGMYQPVWEELQKVPFSDNFEKEILVIVKAIKEASKDLKIKKIISNTQSIAKNAQKFFHSNDGMRVVFSILGNRFSMAAKGDFTGMEAFYIQVNGDSLDGVILRKEEDGNFQDVTENYQINITREK